MSKNEMKANHNNCYSGSPKGQVGKYDVKERDESKSQLKSDSKVILKVGKYDVKERDESKSQQVSLHFVEYQVGKYDVKERDESKSQPSTANCLTIERWQI